MMSGSPIQHSAPVASIAALHGTRLEMMLGRVIDSTVRGVVYEAAGTVGDELLAAGAAELRRACELNAIPYALVVDDPCDGEAWNAAARQAIDGLLAVG